MRAPGARHDPQERRRGVRDYPGGRKLGRDDVIGVECDIWIPAARTSTSASGRGYSGEKKDLFALWVANRPVYAATVIGSDPLELAKKIEKAKGLKGPRLILALAPCPTGWDFEPAQAVEIGRLAVKTGIWPLKEYFEGRIVQTHVPRPRVPVEEYLKLQGRFRHLFEPERDAAAIAEIQARADACRAQAT